MKKLSLYVFLVLLFCGNTIADSKDRDDKLNQLFEQLKKSNNVSMALEIEMKIWNIWSTHPTQENLTESLSKGSDLMSKGELEVAYKIFSVIIFSAPDWAEAWNKRATVLYLMNRYQYSLDDIKITLALEPRHFGALSGQALNYIELKQYEKAIQSYKAAQEIYPLLDSAKKMIPELEQLIDDQAI